MTIHGHFTPKNVRSEGAGRPQIVKMCGKK
jgi:hypothetical protein